MRERDDEQQDPPRRKRHKQVGKLTVDEDRAEYLVDVGELDWSEERLLETDRVETEKALDQLLEQGVVQDVPADSVAGVKHLTTRWEKCWRMSEGKWQYNKWQEFREDLFATGASHCSSRIIDYLARIKGYATFAFYAIDVNFQAPETEDVVVDPPLEYLKRLGDAGSDTNIKWKLLKQLPGRRPAGQRWVDRLVAEASVLRETHLWPWLSDSRRPSPSGKHLIVVHPEVHGACRLRGRSPTPGLRLSPRGGVVGYLGQEHRDG